MRLRAAGLLPALKRAVRLPDDVAVLERLNEAVALLQVPSPTLRQGLRLPPFVRERMGWSGA